MVFCFLLLLCASVLIVVMAVVKHFWGFYAVVPAIAWGDRFVTVCCVWVVYFLVDARMKLWVANSNLRRLCELTEDL